jgi:REP element-mobilizing transposase RayT
MARQLRVEYESAIYHVTVRGNAQQIIFQDLKDRHYFLVRLGESVQTHGVRVYLFCQMENHVHMVVETPRANLGRFMHSVLTGYTVYFNLRHQRHGHLTQGRYGARVVSGDEYLLKLSRYVHLNPVKVKGMAERALSDKLAYLRAYEWSSYRSYIGGSRSWEWLDCEPVLGLMTGKRRERQDRYREYVEKGVAGTDDEFRIELARSPRSIGDEDFREWVDNCYAELLGKRQRPEDVSYRRSADKRLESEEILKAVAEAAGVTVGGLKERRRDWAWKGIAARMLCKHGGLTQRDCVTLLGLGTGSAVSYQVRQAGQTLREDQRLAETVGRLERSMTKRRAG